MVGTHKKMRVGWCNRIDRTHPLGYGYGSHRRKFLVLVASYEEFSINANKPR